MSNNKQEKGCYIADGKYVMYPDGVFYNCETGGDLPQWVFEFRDFCIKHHETLKKRSS